VAAILTTSVTREDWLSLSEGAGPADLPVLTCALQRTASDLGTLLGVAAYLAKPVTRARLGAALLGLGNSPQGILIVEDESDMQQLLVEMVRTILPRCETRLADDGAAALAILEGWRPDAILLDLLMPGMNGYTFLKRLAVAESVREVPVIVITGKGAEDEMIVAGRLEVTRPGGLSVGELVRCVKATLDEIGSPVAASTGEGSRGAPPW
jgi:two-component system chemotaxis response regulator CheY